MRTILLITALAACADDPFIATDVNVREIVECDSSWHITLPNGRIYDPVDGCQAPCADHDDLGTDETCMYVDPFGSSQALQSCYVGSYVEWGGKRGCCSGLISVDFIGVKFSECKE